MSKYNCALRVTPGGSGDPLLPITFVRELLLLADGTMEERDLKFYRELRDEGFVVAVYTKATSMRCALTLPGWNHLLRTIGALRDLFTDDVVAVLLGTVSGDGTFRVFIEELENGKLM